MLFVLWCFIGIFLGGFLMVCALFIALGVLNYELKRQHEGEASDLQVWEPTVQFPTTSEPEQPAFDPSAFLDPEIKRYFETQDKPL